MAEAPKIIAQVLEQLHYIHFPATLAVADLVYLESKITDWSLLPVELHVLDLKNMKQGHERFFRAVKTLSGKLRPGQIVSLNMGEEMQKEISRLKMQSAFNMRSLQELEPQKIVGEGDLRRLLIRYLIRGAYSAVEVALNSTVSCDENYLIKPDKVPFSQFDLISVIDVRGDFINAQFRLCASTEVLQRLASRMLGPTAKIDQEMVESMALELLNLIYGHAKSNLNDKESFRLPSVIPRLLRRSEFPQVKRSTSPSELSILPLVTPMGSFYVEVDFSP